ncbi:MAG TPA: aryl-sulfate sulfotransferase [Bryobacteraceae bacterium]|jgi:hypothetical protein
MNLLWSEEHSSQKPVRFGILLLAAIGGVNLSAMSVSLTPSIDSPAPLGTTVTWTAAVDSPLPGTLVYAFRVRPLNQAFKTIVDYGPSATLNWTTIQHEGYYEMEVSVRNNSTSEVVTTAAVFEFSSLVANGAPSVSRADNPLVYIFSAPSCASGSRMRVTFQAKGGRPQYTPWHRCSGNYSMNFYLAGMRTNTQYFASAVTDSGTTIITGPTQVSYSTSGIPFDPPEATILTPASDDAVNPVLLQSIIGGNTVATDLSGNVLWYAPSDVSFVTRPLTGGTFLAIGQDQTKDPSYQFFREFDLAGTTIAQTNAAQVNVQLAEMGLHPIDGFHHEVRKLSDGSYLVLASSERVLTDVQGPGAVDVIGDTILVLNSNLQVTWAWDSFDHLDTTREAILNETCSLPNPGCPSWYLAPLANDWLHGNALQLTPDGNILYSSRHQDMVYKIDYEDGMGTGAVLWRLGNGGDFQIVSSDPSPWFSHQHDANFLADNTTLTLFDDGDTRIISDPNADSRGQVYSIDEQNLVATLTTNADVGSYSLAVGSAQGLPNGDFHFDSGYILDSAFNISAQSVEVTPDGTVVYAIRFAGLEYRTFRMYDLYTAP